MNILITVLIVLTVFAGLLLFLLAGRRNHPDLAALRGWSYAHRGLFGRGIPENSMAAFRKALEHGYGIELDVHLMKDGNLAVIHDSSLKRTANADVRIEDLTAGDLEAYRLGGTEERIPLFSEVLEVFQGKTPLIVELKSVNNNYATLCEKACNLLDSYKGPYCIESFDPRCIRWLRKHRPDLIRGQLAENWLKTKTSVPWALCAAVTLLLSNAYNRPDFIAYKFEDRKLFSVALCRKLWGVQGVSWTLRTKQDYDTAVQEGWIPIFEGFIP